MKKKSKWLFTPEEKSRKKLTRNAKRAKACVIIPFSKYQIIERDGLNCYLCGKELTHETATVDHVIPICKGGFHAPTNARIACVECNNAKACLNLEEFKPLKFSVKY